MRAFSIWGDSLTGPTQVDFRLTVLAEVSTEYERAVDAVNRSGDFDPTSVEDGREKTQAAIVRRQGNLQIAGPHSARIKASAWSKAAR